MAPLVAALDFMMSWYSVVGFSFARTVRPKATAPSAMTTRMFYAYILRLKETCPGVRRSIARLAFPERPPQHLSDHRLRQLRAELDVRRHLVRRELLAAERAQFLLGRRLARAQHDPGFDRFAS